MLEVKIFLDTEDMYGEHPLHEHITRYLLHHEIRGATLFSGIMGFGSHHHLHAPRRILASDAVPVMILFVDEEVKVRRVLGYLKSILPEGLITLHTVEKV
jgi:uncharacterized protein